MKEQSLQKLSESQSKITQIMNLKKITKEDYKDFSLDEFMQFSTEVTKRINKTKGIEKEQFLEKIDNVITMETRNQLWENNHSSITWAIATLMQDYGRMPTKTEISNKTELSRQTVHKHLKEYVNHSEYLEQIEQFRFMTSKVLAKVYQFAVNGDIRAAKLYFEIIGNEQINLTNNRQIKNQTNYIQINGIVFDEKKIQTLHPDQLKMIETILLTNNHEKPLFDNQNNFTE